MTASKAAPPLGVRLDPTVRRDLERAAKSDARTVSALVRKIILEWLAQHREAKS